MRRQFLYSLLVVVLVACVSYARQAESKNTSADSSAVGTWNGSWQGGSTGKFEMVINKAADGKLTGTLTSHPTDGDGFSSSFKSIDISGGKLTVKLADTNDEVEITLQAALDPVAMKGSYSVRTKAQGEEVDGGTWEAKKK